MSIYTQEKFCLGAVVGPPLELSLALPSKYTMAHHRHVVEQPSALQVAQIPLFVRKVSDFSLDTAATFKMWWISSD